MTNDPSTSRRGALSTLTAAAALFAAASLTAQPGPPGAPGARAGGGDKIAFEVVSIDRETWSVTAKDVETGEQFRFKLPPRAFRGQRFTADLSTGGGGKVTVQAPPEVRLDQATVEAPLGSLRGRAGDPSGGGRDFRREMPSGPPTPGGVLGRYGETGHPGAAASGPRDYEVVSVDSRSWTVEARAGDGSTVSLAVDPEAFRGFRFRAAVEDLRAGQGFELLATNDQPLRDCCTIKARGGR